MCLANFHVLHFSKVLLWVETVESSYFWSDRYHTLVDVFTIFIYRKEWWHFLDNLYQIINLNFSLKKTFNWIKRLFNLAWQSYIESYHIKYLQQHLSWMTNEIYNCMILFLYFFRSLLTPNFSPFYFFRLLDN